MLANEDRTRDRPVENANIIQSKRRDFPLNAPTLPAADRDIAPSQHDLRMPHAIIEVLTDDDLPLRDSIEHIKKMLRGEGGCKQLAKVCWASSRFYAIFINNDKGRKEAGACNDLCKTKELRLFDRYKLRAEKGFFGSAPRPFAQNGSNDRNEHPTSPGHEHLTGVATNSSASLAKAYASSRPGISQSGTSAQLSGVTNGSKAGNVIPSGGLRQSTIILSSPLLPRSYQNSSANRDDEQSSLHSVATSESSSKKEKLCAKCKKSQIDWDLFVRCSLCGRRYHESCSQAPVVEDIDRSVICSCDEIQIADQKFPRNTWQCSHCQKRKAGTSVPDANGPSAGTQSSQQTFIPPFSSINHTESELKLHQASLPKSTASVESVNDEGRRHLSPAGVTQSHQINVDQVSDGSKSMDISSTSTSPSHGTRLISTIIAMHSHSRITEDSVDNSRSKDTSSKPLMSKDDNIFALGVAVERNPTASGIHKQGVGDGQSPQNPAMNPNNDTLLNTPVEPQHSCSSLGRNKSPECQTLKLPQTLEAGTWEQDRPISNQQSDPLTLNTNVQANVERERSSKSPSTNNQNHSQPLVAINPSDSISHKEINSTSSISHPPGRASHPVQDSPIVCATSSRDDCRAESLLPAGSPAKHGSPTKLSPTLMPSCQKCGKKSFSGALCSKCKKTEDAHFQAEILAGFSLDGVVETTNRSNNRHVRTQEEAATDMVEGTDGRYAPFDSRDGEKSTLPLDQHETGENRRGSDNNPYPFLRNPGNNPAARKFSQSSSWYRPPPPRCVDCRRRNLPCTHITQPVEAWELVRVHQARTMIENMPTMHPEKQSPPPKPDISRGLVHNEKKDPEVRTNAARKTAPEARRAQSMTDTESESSDLAPNKTEIGKLSQETNRRRETSEPLKPVSVSSANINTARDSDGIERRTNPTACLDCAQRHRKCTHLKMPQDQRGQSVSDEGRNQQMASIPQDSTAASMSAAVSSQSNHLESSSGPLSDRTGSGQSFGGSRFAPNGISKPPTTATTAEAAVQPPVSQGAHPQDNSLGAPVVNSLSTPLTSGDNPPNLSVAEEGVDISHGKNPASFPATPTSPTSNRTLHVRPNLHWNDLIYLALSRAEHGKLTSNGIVEWIQEEVPGYKNDARMKQSISAVLSMYSKVKCLLYAKEDNPNRFHNGSRMVGPKWLYRLKPLYRTHLSVEYIERTFKETRASDGRIPAYIPIPATNRYVQPSYTEADSEEHADNILNDLDPASDDSADELGENGLIGDSNERMDHVMKKNLAVREDDDGSSQSSDSIPLSKRRAGASTAAIRAPASQVKAIARKEPVKTTIPPDGPRKSPDKTSRKVPATVGAVQHKPPTAKKRYFGLPPTSLESALVPSSDSESEADILGKPSPVKRDRGRPEKSTSIQSAQKQDRVAPSKSLPTLTEKTKAPMSIAQMSKSARRTSWDDDDEGTKNLNAPSYLKKNKDRPAFASPKKVPGKEQRGYFSDLEDNPAPLRPHPSLGDSGFVALDILDEFPETREREVKQNAEELAYFKHWDDDPRYSKKDDFSCRDLFARRPDLHPDNMREGFDDEGKIEEIKARKLGRGDVQRWRRANGGEKMPDLKTSRRFRDPRTWWKDQGTKEGGWFDEDDNNDEGGKDAGAGADENGRMEVERYIESGEKRFKSVKKLLEIPDQDQLELGLDKHGELVFREKAGFNVSGRIKRGRKEFKTGHPDGLDL